MARFLGNAVGRTSVPYVDTVVGLSTVGLLSQVGSGSRLSGIVTSISAGTGLSVNQSTGAVTISASGGNAPTVLYSCNGCWSGSAIIPEASRGAFNHYEIFGQIGRWNYFCSQASFAFSGACGGSCSPTFESWCCTQCTCGWVGAFKCFYSSYLYSCAGAIAWPFGCSSGCGTACAINGFNFHIALDPENACCGSTRGFQYCFSTTGNGGDRCCMGVRNAGYGIPCCGGHPACLRGVCFTTPSGSNPILASSNNIVIVGYGRIT